MNELRPVMPPFGIAYLAAVLARLSIKSILHDDNLYSFTDQQLKDLFKKYDGRIQAIGLTSISTTLKQLWRIARLAKEALPDIPVIVGGPHARLVPEDIITCPEVDIVFTSEAELSIRDYALGKDIAEIDGIYYKKDGKILKNEARNYVRDLDDIPFPSYELFRIGDYHTTKGIAKRHPSSYIITSRGCPHNCTFCSSKALNPTEDKRVRFRSPENVVEEIEYIVKNQGVRELFFSDDMFTARLSHLVGICEGLIKRKLDLIWVCMTHVNHITAEKIRVMKKAGCHQVCFGVESGDPDIQKAINKNLDFDKVKSAVQMTQQEGIDVRCSFMFGNQYETPETMQRTINLAKRLKPDFASFNIAAPYPGTFLRSWALNNGYLANPNYEALDSTIYTIVTDALPSGTVEEFCNKAFQSFYYNPMYILRRISKINDLEELLRVSKSAYYAFKSLPVIIKSLLKKTN